jgi:hypothetical protein
MKKFFKILIFSLLSISTFAQQTSEIDSKFVKLPRYDDLAAIKNVTTGITTPTQGMMVYNNDTKSNWSFNGTVWINTLSAVAAPLSLTSASASTISSTNTGTIGYSGRFENNNIGNNNPTLNVVNNAVGSAARIYIDNVGSSNNALVVSTVGTGRAISALNNSSTSATVKFTNSEGTGLALETSGGLKFGSPNVGTPAAGKVLTAMDNQGNAQWQDIPPLSSPLTLTSSGSTFTSIAAGTSGVAGRFQIDNPLNSNTSLYATTNGLGSAGNFSNTNASASASVIDIKNQGTGYSINIEGQNALFADGLIKNKGFIELGELSPKIKTVTFGEYIGAGSVQTITHNLNAGKILSINVFASLETGLPPYLRIPPSFISLGTDYYYDYYFDDTKIYFIIPSTSTKVKNFFARVLIS